MLTARKLVQSKLQDHREQPARDLARLRAEGRQDDAKRSFAGRIEELVTGHPNLETIGAALLRGRVAVLLARVQRL